MSTSDFSLRAIDVHQRSVVNDELTVDQPVRYIQCAYRLRSLDRAQDLVERLDFGRRPGPRCLHPQPRRPHPLATHHSAPPTTASPAAAQSSDHPLSVAPGTVDR
ncbi:hypothetical protein ACRAKI_26770 [Saccharothrix isguenensis]